MKYEENVFKLCVLNRQLNLKSTAITLTLNFINSALFHYIVLRYCSNIGINYDVPSANSYLIKRKISAIGTHLKQKVIVRKVLVLYAFPRNRNNYAVYAPMIVETH